MNTDQPSTQPTAPLAQSPHSAGRVQHLEACIAEGPQMVTKRGAEAAVLVPVEQWRRLQAAARPTLKQLLLADEGRVEMLTPPRRVVRRRNPLALG